MIRVRMTKTTPGSLDGINIQQFVEGEVYTISPSLATSFIAMEVCEMVGSKPDTVETKVDEPEEVKKVVTKQGTHQVTMGGSRKTKRG